MEQLPHSPEDQSAEPEVIDLVDDAGEDNMADDVETVVDQRLNEDPEVQSARSQLAGVREKLEKSPGHSDYSEQEKQLVQTIKGKQAAYHEEEARSRGEYKSAEELAEEEETARLTRLAEVRASLTGKEQAEELLRKIKLIDEEGKLRFNPDLVSPRTRVAWRKYQKLVNVFMGASMASESLGMNVKGIQQTDRARSEAHDAVAQSLAEDLAGIMGLTETRRYVTKMREQAAPNTGEMRSIMLAAKKQLEKYGGDLSDVAEDILS